MNDQRTIRNQEVSRFPFKKKTNSKAGVREDTGSSISPGAATRLSEVSVRSQHWALCPSSGANACRCQLCSKRPWLQPRSGAGTSTRPELSRGPPRQWGHLDITTPCQEEKEGAKTPETKDSTWGPCWAPPAITGTARGTRLQVPPCRYGRATKTARDSCGLSCH